MYGWLSGLVADKMEEIMVNYTKNLMATAMPNYNIKTHQTGDDGETSDQNFFKKLANNDKQDHQEDSDGKSHLHKVTHNLLKEVNQMKRENDALKKALFLEKIKKTNSLITESKCNETVQIKCCHKENKMNETTERKISNETQEYSVNEQLLRENEKLQMQLSELRVLMEEMESMNKINRKFEQEVDFLEKQIKDMKWKFSIQENINKEATEKLVNEMGKSNF